MATDHDDYAFGLTHDSHSSGSHAGDPAIAAAAFRHYVLAREGRTATERRRAQREFELDIDAAIREEAGRPPAHLDDL